MHESEHLCTISMIPSKLHIPLLLVSLGHLSLGHLSLSLFVLSRIFLESPLFPFLGFYVDSSNHYFSFQPFLI